MLLTTSGSRMFIGASHPDWTARMVTAADFGAAWVEITGLTSLGRIAGEWEVTTDKLPSYDRPEDAPFPQVQKMARPAKSIAVTADLDLMSPGQLRLIAAEDSLDAFEFKILLPGNPAPQRLFVGLVTGLDDVMEEADMALGLAATITLQSNVVRA